MVDFLAIIPARGGSKGILGKNIIDFCGKPLIAHTIIAALNSKYIQQVVVTTDCDEIAKVAESYGANIIKRPTELATDTAKTIDAVLHVIENSKSENIVLLQPTSPLRQTFHIDEAIEVFLAANNSVVSVNETKSPLLIRDNANKPILERRSDVRRQDSPVYNIVNGAIYINKTSEVTQDTSFNDNILSYVMDKKYSIDIDEPLDLKIAELVYHDKY